MNIETVCIQYIHGLAARGVHYLHRPGPTLQDLGFMLLPVSYFHSFSIEKNVFHKIVF